MMNEKMLNAFNDQINKEFYSAYLYLSMSNYLAKIGLSGFANWMRVQFQEEQAHAMLMFDYIVERGESVVLKPIDQPEIVWKDILDVYEHVLSHEQYVTSLIHKLADVAEETKDRAALGLLDWFLKEQVEEEAAASDIISKLKLINCEGNAIFMMDKEFALRTFIQPVIA